MTVTATDASTDTTIASASTTVTVAQAPPQISLSVNPVTPTAGTPANFLFGIAPGQALPVTVRWSFGDGSTSNGTTHSTSHTYAAAGTFTATVTETDTAGETLTATLSVVVAPHAIGPADPSLSTVVADPPGALTATAFGSGGAIKSTIYVTLLDQWRRPVSGARVGLLGDSTSVTFPGGKTKGTDARGQAVFTVEDGKAETVHFSATDITDNISILQTAAVTFGPEAMKVAIDVSPTSLPGDGVAQTTVTVTLTDGHGHPAPENAVTLVTTRTAGIATVSAPPEGTTDANGVATFALRARNAGTFSLSVQDKTAGKRLTPSPHATVSFTAAPGGPADAANSTIAVDTQSVPADGTSKATITVTLHNAAGGVVPGSTVTLHTSSGGVRPSAKAATTDANGVATFTATATSAATATFTADDLSDSLTLGPTPAVSFYAHVPDASTSSIVTSPSAEPDDGTSASLVTVTLRDLGGAVTPGDLVLLAASGRATVTAVSSIADAHGVATFRVADATPETVTLSAQVPAANVTFGGTTIVFGAHETSATRSSVHASPTSVVDDGHAKTAITVTLVDSFGSPIVGHHVTVVANGGHSSTPGGSTFDESWGLPAGTTGHNGTVTVEFVDSHDETVTYSAVDDTIGMTLSKTATVAFSPRASAATSTISASPVSVPPGGSSTVTVTLRDVNGEPVIGRHVNIYGTDVAGGKGAAVQIASRTTDASGSATFLLKRSGGTQLSLTAEVPADGVVVKPHPSLVVSFAAPTGGTVDTSRSTVSASPADARAASGSSTVTVTLRNSQNGAVSGKSVSLHAATGHSSISPASATTDANGAATFTVSDATVETATYSAVDTTDSLTPAATATVDFYGHTPDPQTSFITATPAKVADDGSSSSTVKVTLEDLGGAAVSGKRVVLHATGSATITPLAATTNSSGVATFHVTDEVPETVTLTAVDSFDRITLANPSYVRFVAFPSATLSTLVADHTNVASNGKAVVTVTATLLDARGRSVPGTLVDLIPLSGHSNVKRVTENQNSVAGNTLGGGAAAITTGTATNAFAITDTTAETVTYEAIDEADGITLAQTVTVTFSPPADPAHSFISISSPTIPADRTTPATVTVTFETSSGAPAVGKEVELVLSGSGSLKVDGGADGITDTNGTVTYTVTGFIAGTKTLVAVDHSDAWLHGHVTVAVETPPAQLTIG